MKKLDSGLSKKITLDLKKEFNVLIVIDTTFDIENLNLSNYKKLMSNIIYAKLTGKKIRKISNHPSVLSIEEDKEMGIL